MLRMQTAETPMVCFQLHAARASSSKAKTVNDKDQPKVYLLLVMVSQLRSSFRYRIFDHRIIQKLSSSEAVKSSQVKFQ